MWVESRPCEGSAFLFALPISTNVASALLRREWETWAKPSDPKLGGWRKVAVYGGHADASRQLQRYLDGYEVVAEENIDRVRELVDESEVCAVALIGSSGPETWGSLREIQARVRDVPIVVCPLRGGVTRSRGEARSSTW